MNNNKLFEIVIPYQIILLMYNAISINMMSLKIHG